MVAMRPDVSWRMCRRRADVGEASALPTPTPGVVLIFGVGLLRELGGITLENCAGGEEACY